MLMMAHSKYINQQFVEYQDDDFNNYELELDQDWKTEGYYLYEMYNQKNTFYKVFLHHDLETMTYRQMFYRSLYDNGTGR